MSKKRILFYFLSIVVVACALRTPSLLVGFVNIDENEYALAGKIITQGGIPYRDFLIYQPPVIYYLYALVIQLIPAHELVGSMWWVHVLMLGIVVLTCLAIFLATRSIFERADAALFGALFYAVFSTTFLPQDMLAANIELVMVLPMTLACWFLLRRQYLLAGLLLGLSILTKYQGGILLPVFAIYLFKKQRWQCLKGLASCIAGCIVLGSFWIYYLYSQGALPDAIRCFQYILDYAKGPSQSDPIYVGLKFLMRTALIGLGGFGLWYFALRQIPSSKKGPAFLPILWLLFGSVAVLAGGRLYFHYYLIVYPALAILAGGRVALFFDRLRGMPFEKEAWRLVLFILMIFVPVTGFTAYATYKPFRPKHKDYWIYVVDYIRDRTKAEDSIFVWGYCPQIYTASNRKPATRFTTSDYLTGRSPRTAGLEYDPKTSIPPSLWAKLRRDFITPREVIDYDTSGNIYPGAWDLLMRDLEKTPPVVIVDTSPSNYRMHGRYPIDKFPMLHGFVKRHYVFEATIRRMDIYRKIKNKKEKSKTITKN